VFAWIQSQGRTVVCAPAHTTMYVERSYRQTVQSGLVDFQVKLAESDLWLSADRRLARRALTLLRQLRRDLEAYIARHPEFAASLEPVRLKRGAPAIAREMAHAARAAGVGPMAAVAGAIAEAVGRGLLQWTREVIVENGGDIFLDCSRPKRVAIFAGASPLSQRVGLQLEPAEMPLGVCTSSGTVGPSLSFGRADAATILARSTALADAAATAVGNAVKTVGDIAKGLQVARRIPGVRGAVIIKDDRLGAWGQVTLIPL
jgi:hypothetical protein